MENESKDLNNVLYQNILKEEFFMNKTSKRNVVIISLLFSILFGFVFGYFLTKIISISIVTSIMAFLICSGLLTSIKLINLN